MGLFVGAHVLDFPRFVCFQVNRSETKKRRLLYIDNLDDNDSGITAWTDSCLMSV